MTRSRQLTLGVIGGGRCTEVESRLAFETGREIARAEAVLICGGGTGVMEAACSGAKTIGGATIGVLPGTGPDDTPPNSHVDTVLYTGMGQARNQVIVLSSDAVIAIGGEWGTLSEIALAFKYDIPIVLLQSWTMEGPEGQGLLHLNRAATAKEAVAKARRALADPEETRLL